MPELVAQVLHSLSMFSRSLKGCHHIEREKDHAITIQEGTRIPNLRPYKYPNHQKDEIEKMVRDRLTAGIIRTSTSPYASLVILAKKKGGS